MSLFNFFGGSKAEMHEIPNEIKTQLDYLRQIDQESQRASDEQLLMSFDFAMRQESPPMVDIKTMYWELISAQICGVIGERLVELGHEDDAQYWFNHALQMDERAENTRGQIKSAAALGDLYRRRGNFEEAMKIFQKMLKCAENLSDPTLLSALYNEIGLTYRRQGQYSKAIDYYLKGLKIDEELGDDNGLAASYGNLGNVYTEMGALTKALEMYEQALVFGLRSCDDNLVRKTRKFIDEIKTKQNKRINEPLPAIAVGNEKSALNLLLKGGQKLASSNWLEARECFLEALEMSENLGDPMSKCMALSALGHLLINHGEFSNALELCQEALKLAEELNDPFLQSGIYDEIGTSYYGMSQYPQAIEYFKRVTAISEASNDNPGIFSGYGNLGMVYLMQGDFEKAMEVQLKSLELALKQDNDMWKALSYGNLGTVYHAKGQFDKAEESYNESLAISNRIQDNDTSANQYGNLGALYAEHGRYDDAIDVYNKALSIKKASEAEPGVGLHYGNLATCYQKMGDIHRARDFFDKSLDILERIKDYNNAAKFYFNRGLLYSDNFDNPSQASADFNKAKALFELVGDADSAQKAAHALRGFEANSIFPRPIEAI